MKASRLQRLQEKSRKRNAVEPTPVAAKPTSEKPISQDEHFTANEVAELWGIHPSTVRRIFASVVGVIKLGVGKYRTLLIPARVLELKHQELAA